MLHGKWAALPGGDSHIGSYQRWRCAARMGNFPGRNPADGCKFLTKNLRMGHNFDLLYSKNETRNLIG